MLNRRDFLKAAGIGIAAAALAAACAEEPKEPTSHGPESEPRSSATFDPVPTSIPEFSLLPTQEQLAIVLETILPVIRAERKKYWQSEFGKKIFQLSHYESYESHTSVDYQTATEPLINSEILHIVLAGFDGQAGRSQDFGKMNCDALISFFINPVTAQLTAYCHDRSMPGGRGKDFKGDADILSRIALTSSPDYRILGETSPSENITHSLTIMTGRKPDGVYLMDMEGFKYLYTLLSEDNKEAEKALHEIRDRSDNPAGDRSMVAVELGIKLVKSAFDRGLGLTTRISGADTRAGILDILKVGMSIANVQTGNSGNLMNLLNTRLNELDLPTDVEQKLVNELLDSIIYLRLTDSGMKKTTMKGGNGPAYPESDLINKVKSELTKLRNQFDPHSHDFNILVKEDSRSGHNLVTLPEVFLDNAVPIYDQDLNKGITSYETALEDPSELQVLKKYFSVLRHILSRYLPDTEYSWMDKILISVAHGLINNNS